MNNSKAIQMSVRGFTLEYARQMERAFQNIKPSDAAAWRGYIFAMRKAIFLLGRAWTEGSLDEIHAIASAFWPDVFSTPKLGLTSLTEEEETTVKTVAARYAEGPSNPDFVRNLLLARLFLVSYREPMPSEWHNISPGPLRMFVEFQLETPQLILPGDSEKYYRHLNNFLTKLWEFVSSPNTSEPHIQAALAGFLNSYSTNLLMVLDQNALPIMEMRHKLLTLIARKMFRSDLDWKQPPKTEGKIRLGIIIKTFMAGGETWAALANIAGLDRTKYEIILFCLNHDAGYYHDITYYREMVAAVDNVVLISGNSAEIAATRIRDFNLDILWHQSHLGLSESNQASFLAVHKLARVQCATYMMHAHTTGNPYFQYFINIPTAFPPKTWEGEFSETEMNIPGVAIHIPDHWRDKPSQIVTREMLGIPSDAIVYFGGAAAGKYNHEFLATWLDIIKHVPNGYLVLYPFNPAWCPRPETIVAFHARMQNVVDASGVSPERIKVLDGMNGEAIIGMHQWGHVFLSSFPYGGVTSLSDALRGELCPVVGAGKYSRSNGDSNILAACGLLDMVARTPQEYAEKAIRLGTDAGYRASVKARVKESQSKRPLFRAQVTASYAAIIDQIAAKEFGAEETAPSAASKRA